MTSFCVDCPDCGQRFYSHYGSNSNNSRHEQEDSIIVKRPSAALENYNGNKCSCRFYRDQGQVNFNREQAMGNNKTSLSKFLMKFFFTLWAIWIFLINIILYPFISAVRWIRRTFLSAMNSQSRHIKNGCTCTIDRGAEYLLNERYALVENYVDSLSGVGHQLNEVLNLQALNIKHGENLLKSLIESSDQLNASITDCLEEHEHSINQFKSDLADLEVQHENEETDTLASFEETTKGLKRNLYNDLWNNRQEGIANL